MNENMGGKAEGMGEELKGKAKKALGDLTDSPERVAEGEAQVEKGRAVQNVEDEAKRAAEAEEAEVKAQLHK